MLATWLAGWINSSQLEIIAVLREENRVLREQFGGLRLRLTDDVLVAHFDPNAGRVVGASLDGTARVWDATPPYRRWRSPPLGDNCSLNSEPDRRFVAVGCRDRPTGSGTRRATSCSPSSPA